MTRMILLNPGPANTSEAVKQAMTVADICPRERSFGAVLGKVRDGLTRVVHQGDAYTAVLFGGSGTAGVEATIGSAVPADGRLLVVENGAYGCRIGEIASACGVEHVVESFGVGEYPDVDRIARRLDESRFTQLAVIHHETTTGMLNPVEAIGQACRSRGVEMIVDAMSSYAGVIIDVEAMGADFLISSSNKCIQGMAGLCFVICKKDRLADMQTIAGRSYYLNLSQQHRFFESSGQMRFTPPVQIVYALEQALHEYFHEGAAARQDRYLANWKILDDGMTGLGFRRLLPEAILSRILTAYIEPDHPAYSYDLIHDSLFEKGFTIYPGKGATQDTFRLANMGDVSGSDMERFVLAMTQTLQELGVDPLYGS